MTDLDPAAWIDRSGHFGAMATPDPAVHPTVVPGGLYSHSTVRFTEHMFNDIHFASNTGGVSAGVTVFAVVKADCTGSYHNIIDRLGQNDGQTPTAANQNDFMLWVDPDCFFELGTGSGVRSAATADHWQVVTAVLGDPILGGIASHADLGMVTLYTSVDGVEMLEGQSAGSSAQAGASTDSVYYSLFNRAGAQKFSGEIAEMMIYDVALSQEERLDVFNFLQAKWGLWPGDSAIVPTDPGTHHGHISDSTVCGITAWRTWDECRAGEPTGGVHIGNSGVGGAPITTLEECVAAAVTECPLNSQYVSFSTVNGDCSWYSECDLLAPPLGLNHYQSTQILGGPHSGGAEGGGECTPEALDLTQSAVSASSTSTGNDEMTALGHTPGPENAIDRDTATYWEMQPGARDPAVMNSAWYAQTNDRSSIPHFALLTSVPIECLQVSGISIVEPQVSDRSSVRSMHRIYGPRLLQRWLGTDGGASAELE